MPQYVLQPPAAREPGVAPALDDEQRAVVEHGASPGSGPLLVLAGPGTGKTTTVVETVVERIEREALSPDQVLVLTFSRKAADEVRGRIAHRLARTTAATPAMTFHAFCYALLRHEQSSDAYTNPMRLLSAPEQDAAIAELLRSGDPQAWPRELRGALHTRGLATELQRLMASARALGMDSLDVETVGRRLDRADWQSAGRFFDEYTSVAALENTIDHTDMIFQAVRLLGDPDVRERWRRRFRLVVVDEYQDTDPLQVRFLAALAGGGDLVAVGDPYQSIYGFRGADVHGILDFQDEFGVDGQPAPAIVLQHTHRYGSTIGAAVRSVVHHRGALGPVDGSKYEALRSPVSRVDDDGRVEVRTFVSPTAEVEHVALLLREAHLHHDVAWTDMAVLVRSGAHLGRLQRALGAAGVPVEVAGDEVPLALEPSVRTLLSALHAADDLQHGRAIEPSAAAALLTGPLGGLDAASLRRLGRVLRRAESDHPRPSRLLVAEALADPSALAAPAGTPEAEAVDAAQRLAGLLRRAAGQIAAGDPAEQVLWTLWDGTEWPDRLHRQSEAGGDGALQADHDLDALCALFAEAARAEEQHAHRSVVEIATALEAQQIPADTLAQQGAPSRAVQLMTAHRAKGLEWPLVVVAGVQDGEWPDARWRSSLLQVERMGPDGLREPPSARSMIAEERRLFYVACSRAQTRLVVTAVAAGADDGDQPSRFVGELHAHLHGQEGRTLPEPENRPRRALSLRGAVAELRRIGESTTSPAVRARAAEALAAVVDQQGGAHPDRWWGLRELTSTDAPIRDPDEPLRLSGSAVSTMEECPLKWFLSREARGERGSSAAQGFGSIVHAIAAEVVRSGVDADPDQLAKHLDSIWDQLEHPAGWIGAREHEAAVDAIIRFTRWHREHGREVLAAEHEFEVAVDVDGRAVLMGGSMDRVELSGDGVHVVDLKTSKNPPQKKEIAEHPQLGFYQLAVEHGAAAGLPGVEAAGAAGAELVQLRNDETGVPGYPKVQAQDGPRPDEPFFAVEQLRRSVHALSEEEFVATASTKSCGYCQFQRVCPAQDEGATILVEGQVPMNPVRDEAQLCELLGIPFTDEQLAAITAGADKPGVIIAGAGSGKTSVMAARVVWLVGHLDVPPERVLGLTFTNKAAAELGQRIRASLQLLGADADGEPTTSTYHAFAGSLITEHGLRLGVEPDLRLVTDASRFQRMARAIESFPDDLRDVTTHVPSLVSQAMNLDAQLSEHLVEPEVMRTHDDDVIREFLTASKPQAVLRDAAAAAHKRIELSHLVDRYRTDKAVDGVMDFSDQMAWGAKLALLPEVGAVLRERFGIVLLDEYQDTSVAQRDLLQALFSGRDAESGRGFPVTAVGDPAQAIYGWRGAAVGNLEQFLDDFPRADGGRGRQYGLTETRRCAPEIIDIANRVVAPFYATSDAVRPLTSATEPGGRVDVALYDTIEAEISAMVDAITATPGRYRDIAILVRVARENGAIVQALREAHIPFEIVGLEGLLSQPEVLDLLALLEVVEDVTANPAMLRLLTGPRWRIGPRDLALLGRRASALTDRSHGRDDDATLESELRRAVEGVDPTEIVSLADAVDDPGDLPFSPEARSRFQEISRLVSSVRAHVGEPLLDLARRGVRALDLDLELAAGDIAGGADNIALLLEAIADYSHTDRYASLSGLVAYLDAERFYTGGMEVSTPSEADSVKLLTIHRAKGLEWPTVFVPLVSRTIFPSEMGRSRWISSAQTLPGPLRGDADSLPVLTEWTAAARTAYIAADREDALMEERRLAYVAFTRAARRLTVSGHYWGRTQQKPLGPSPFLIATRDWLGQRGISPQHWADPPEQDATNPHLVEADGIAWPADGPGLDGRRALAADVREALDGRLEVPAASEADRAELDRLDELAHDVELLAVEAAETAQDVRVVPWPTRMSATLAMELSKDRAEFTRRLARPMPRPPSPAARFGTRFHAWIEDHYGMTGLFDPTDLPGRGDVGIDTDTELDRLKEMFLASEFAARTPEQIEAPFSLLLGGQQFSGRIDAVFASADAGATRYEVVDWKTNAAPDADPLQLAIYRLAWAELTGVDLDLVTGAFYYARLGQTVRYGPDDLLDRAGLEQALGLHALP